MTQPSETTLARKWKIDIDNGSDGSWIPIGGLNEFKPSPQTPTLEADNAYEDGGWLSKTKTALEWSLELKLLRRVSAVDPISYDPGQERLRTLSGQFGALGVAHVRWYDRERGPEAYEGWAEVEWNSDGGSVTDLEKATVQLHGKGERFIIINPDL